MLERVGDVARLLSAALDGKSDSTGATNNLQSQCQLVRAFQEIPNDDGAQASKRTLSSLD